MAARRGHRQAGGLGAASSRDASPRRLRQAGGLGACDSIGIDTGGTFTDVVAWRDGARVAFKLPSTPHDPSAAVLDSLLRACAGHGTRVRHGSTVATNALLERKGARVTLVTTAGFERGTGVMLNIVSPEAAAAQLRRQSVKA